jgi:hypothetical protein
MNIMITMKSGEVKRFMHQGRPGGGWTKSIRYEGAFAIITDEWSREIAIPVQDIKEIKTDQRK